MRTRLWLRLFLLVLAIGLLVTLVFAYGPWGARPTALKKAGPRILYYRSPMNPAIHSPVPLKDSMGMSYLPVYAHGHRQNASAPTSFHVDHRLRQSYGVRTVIIGAGQSPIVHGVPGIVTVDQHRLVAVNPRLDGWLRSLKPDAVGDDVRRRAVIGQLYAPALRAAESDYLMLKRGHAGPRLLQAVAMRLERLGLGSQGIKALAHTNRVPATLPLYAPASGVVVTIGSAPGRYVTPSTSLLTIAPRSPVWVRLALPPATAGLVRVGDAVVVRAAGGFVAPGMVSYIYPAIDPLNRTLTVRVKLPNPKGWLRPGLYVQARITAPSQAATLTIPRSAVLHTGTGIAYVFVATGGGHFRLQRVTLGPTSGRELVVRQGLSKGARVVVHGLFLLDADSHIHGLAARLAGSRGPHD